MPTRRNGCAIGFDLGSLSTLQLRKSLCCMELKFCNWVRLVGALFARHPLHDCRGTAPARRPSAEALLPPI